MLLLLLACQSEGAGTHSAAESHVESARESDSPADTNLPGEDHDQDGYSPPDDCDDDDTTVHPGALDGCDDIDQDCDGLAQEGCSTAPTGTLNLSAADAVILGTASVLPALAVASAGDADGDGSTDLWVAGAVDADGDWQSGGWLLPGPLSAREDPEESWSARRMDNTMAEATVTFVSHVGDVDGDGLPELGFDGFSMASGVLRSPVTGDAGAQDSELYVHTSGNQYTELLRGAGDQNGDGTPDLLLTGWGDPSGATAGILFGPRWGEVAAGDWDVDLGLIDTDRGLCTIAEGLGDVDGDGIDDLAIGEGEDGYYGYCAYGETALWILPGPVDTDLIVSERGARLTAGRGDYDDEVYAVTALDDADGDGKRDLAVAGKAADGAPSVWILAGDTGTTVIPDAAWATLTSSDDAHDGLAYLESAHDVNDDGFEDLVMSGYDLEGSGSDPGGAWIAYGPFLGGVDLVTNGALLIDDEGIGRVARYGVAGLGDTNGDGFDDVAVGCAPFADEGRAWVVLGGL